MANQIVEMAKPHLRHSSLFIKVNLVVLPHVQKLNFVTRADWFCGKDGHHHLENLCDNRIGDEIPLIIFTEDCIDSHPDKAFTTGCAHLYLLMNFSMEAHYLNLIFRGCACGTNNGRNIATIDLSFCRNSARLHVRTAQTLAHEIGHMVRVSFLKQLLQYDLILITVECSNFSKT